jgi:ribose-phosphate pyrophosphokinase
MAKDPNYKEKMKMDNLAIFSGTSNLKLSVDICTYIGVLLNNSIVSDFPDGEVMVKINDDVRGKDCFVIQSTCPPVNDNIMQLLIYVDCLKRASAKSITVVIPYFGYARQDRKTEGRTPITAKMIADLITTVGASRVLTMDLHAQQIEGFFNIPVDHLKAVPVFVNYLKLKNLKNTVILSPDVGNMKTANLYAQELDLDIAVIDKRRINGEETIASNIIGEVENKNVLIFDDMISTGGTICSAVSKVKEEGGKNVSVCATHGLFSSDNSYSKLVEAGVNEICVADTIPLKKDINVKTISVSKLLGEAIVRIYQKRSVSVLLESNYYENRM